MGRSYYPVSVRFVLFKIRHLHKHRIPLPSSISPSPAIHTPTEPYAASFRVSPRQSQPPLPQNFFKLFKHWYRTPRQAMTPAITPPTIAATGTPPPVSHPAENAVLKSTKHMSIIHIDDTCTSSIWMSTRNILNTRDIFRTTRFCNRCSTHNNDDESFRDFPRENSK